MLQNIKMVLQVLKLHTKLGKPIPSTDPVVIAASASSSSTTAKASTAVATKTATATATVKKVLATPKITFVGKYRKTPKNLDTGKICCNTRNFN